jgi:hypothetical protein
MRMFFAAVAMLTALAVAPTEAGQRDSGLRCSFSPGSPMVAGEIKCTVHADEVTVEKVTFNRGTCPARFDDPRAERAYYAFWNDTPENREWWQRTSYRGKYRFGSQMKVEASASCGSIVILEFEIHTTTGVFTWTVGR